MKEDSSNVKFRNYTYKFLLSLYANVFFFFFPPPFCFFAVGVVEITKQSIIWVAAGF